MFDRKNFVSDSDWEKFLEFSKNLETPNIVINLNTIKKNFIKFIYYKKINFHLFNNLHGTLLCQN